jgi:hypothetical protein
VTPLKLSTLLKLDIFAGARLLAGKEAVDNQVSWVNLMEILDSFDQLQSGELLISTGFGLKNSPRSAETVISQLAGRHIAGLALQPGYYIEKIPPAFLRSADAYHLPLIELPAKLTFGKITKALFDVIGHAPDNPAGDRSLLRLEGSLRGDETAMVRLIDDLLERGDHPEEKSLALRADLLGFDLSLPYRSGILRPVPASPKDDETAETFREGLFARIRAYPFRFDALHWRPGKAQCVLLFSSSRDDGAMQFRRALAESSVLPEGARCEIGLGGIAGTCEEIPRSYREAQAALTLGKFLKHPDPVTSYDSVLALDFLHAPRPEGELERLYRGSVAPLRQYDRANRTQLALTLKIYLEFLHKAQAARELSIHRQTMAYRLNRIREITGRDPENPDDRLILLLGFAVEAFLAEETPRHR